MLWAQITYLILVIISFMFMFYQQGKPIKNHPSHYNFFPNLIATIIVVVIIYFAGGLNKIF